MSAPDTDIRHFFGGGIATDLGTVAELPGSTRTEIPFLLTADNAYFELNGNLRKVGGTTRWNTTALEGGLPIRGMFEYVRAGSGGNPTRKRVAHVGTKVKADDNDGVFIDIKTGVQADSVPNYTVFTDVLIWADDSSNPPQKWDQTTVSNLGGNPPNFAFSAEHVNRLWAAGDDTLPSRLYYSAQLNPEDWSSFDAGHIDIAPSDGDVITGIYSHRGVLFVFKGPNFGSIHVITGRTPSDFARDLFSGEVGGVGPNTIFTFLNDVGFLALDGSIRSLSTTEKFGDFEEAALSRPISHWMKEHMNSSALKQAWARTDPTRGYVVFTLPIYGATAPNYILCMDYKFQPVRFTTWSSFGAYSVQRMSDPTGNNRPILYLGGNDGFIRKVQQGPRKIDGAEYRFFVQTPYFHYNTQNRLKTISHYGVGMEVRDTSTVTLTIRRSSSLPQSIDITPATTGFTLDAGSPNPFILDISTLAGNRFVTHWGEVDVGQFREVSYELLNNIGDFEVAALHMVFEQEQNPSYENG